MSKGLQVRWEAVLYLVIGTLAAGLRLGGLNWPPLTEVEARQALGAAWNTPGASPHWTPSEGWAPQTPAYNTFTRWIFHFGAPDEARARLVPALAGLGLVLAPLWMRPRLGRGSALMTSLVLAVSPSLVTVSRTAGGESIALVGIATCLAVLLGEDSGELPEWRWFGAAAAAGLALASGPAVFTAGLGLALSLLALRVFGRGKLSRNLIPPAMPSRGWVVAAALAAMLLVATAFGTSLQDAAGVAGSLSDWVGGWGRLGGTGALTGILTLILYEPLALLFGVVGLLLNRGSEDGLVSRCGAWAGCALLVLLAYPSRQPADLTWIVLPLAVLAGRSLALTFDRISSRWTWLGHGTLIAVLLLFSGIIWMQLANYAAGRGPGLFELDPGASLGLAAAVLVVALVILVLYAAGWSVSLALESAGGATAVVLVLVCVSTLWRLDFASSAADAGDLWRAEATGPGVELVLKTLEGVSQAHTGRIDALPVTTAGETSAVMAWVLRDFPRAAEALPSASPEVIVTTEGGAPEALAAEYLGQTLTVGERRAWQGILPPEPVQWWMTPQAPTEPVRWLLLVRCDLATFGEEPPAAP
ncbi:MAG: hypothetical protein AB1449_00995 [Chloroflexota bacterium]